MRHFHKQKNHYHCPIVNLDKLWTLVGEEVSAAVSVCAGSSSAWLGSSGGTGAGLGVPTTTTM